MDRMEGSGRPLTSNLQSIDQYSIISTNQRAELAEKKRQHAAVTLGEGETMVAVVMVTRVPWLLW